MPATSGFFLWKAATVLTINNFRPSNAGSARTGRRVERIVPCWTDEPMSLRSPVLGHPVSAISCARLIPSWPRRAMRASRISAASPGSRVFKKWHPSPGIRRNRRRVEHDSSADGHDRRKLAHDKAISRQEYVGSAKRNLANAVSPGRIAFLRGARPWRWFQTCRHAGARGPGLSRASPKAAAERTSTREVGRNVDGGAASCRAPSLCVVLLPDSSAVRWPATARSAGCPCTCTPRTRTRWPWEKLPARLPCESCPQPAFP